jgi:hypothetical protein
MGFGGRTGIPFNDLVAPLNLLVTLGEIMRHRDLVNRSTTGW